MKKKDKLRFRLLYAVVLIAFGFVVVRLVNLQVRGPDDYGEDYAAKAESSMTKKIYETGLRGQVLDVNGAVLATNRRTYNVAFYRNPSSGSDQNGIYSKSIWAVLQLLEKEGKEVTFKFWMKRDESGEWVFDTGTTDENVAAAREKMFRSNFYITKTPLEEIYEKLCTTYKIHEIGEDLTEEDKLKVLSVWQEMQMNAFNTVPIILAKDVTWTTAMEIETRMVTLDGISIEVQNQRVYPKGALACHIIGYTGPMQQSTLESYLEKGYLRTDHIGLAGVEASMETWLSPNSALRRGYTVVEIDRNGRKIRELEHVEPNDGNTVKLTIDSALQQVAESALEETINTIRTYEETQMKSGKWLEKYKEILDDYAERGRKINLAQNGAIVVLDMKCRVLAMASYPNFNPNWFVTGMTEEQYKRNVTDERNPLYNNAIMSASTPGSVFKMATALAALTNGVLTVNEQISDEGYFKLYDETNPPKCWIAINQRGKHANQTIVEGLAHSCNYFFYTIASNLGKDGQKLYQYAAKLGLASKTNIDLPGERKSVVGSQVSLYDPTRPITEFDQDTAKPIIIRNSIKAHLRAIGEEDGINYTDERLNRCVKALMDMAIETDQGPQNTNWAAHIRPILMEELGMKSDTVWLARVVSPIARDLNEIKWGGTNTIMTAIGQSITMTTPIAMARYIVALANGGYVYDVQLIDSIVSPTGEVLNSFDTPMLVNDLSAEIEPFMPYIRQGMADVVSDQEGGTAADYFNNWKYTSVIAAKTGSAQTSKLDLESNAWFVAFAPRDNPEIAVVVFVPYGLGGSRAAPAAQKVIEYYLDSKTEEAAAVLPAPNGLAQ